MVNSTPPATPAPHLTRILIAVLLVMLALPALQPLMRGQLLWTADGTLHLYRLISLDHALADGSLWTRYAAGMAYGYGAPMFNYYSPLSLYPLLALHNLGLSFLDSWLWGMMLLTLIAVLGAYWLGKAWSNDLGGILVAAAYLYAPYSLFDLLWRGTVAEWASLAVLPYVLWGITRLMQTRHWRYWLLTVIAFALFIPMHNVITLHGSALIGVYALFVMMSPLPNPSPSNGQGQGGGENGKRHLGKRFFASAHLPSFIHLFSALGISALIAAFFWLPAISETRYIKLDAITATLPFIDVVGNLTPLANVFALPTQADPTQMQPPLAIALSWVQMGFAVIACAFIWRSREVPRYVKALVLFCLMLIMLLVFMNTPASALIWQSIPLIRYSQYPWRLLGLASLLLALVMGVSVAYWLDSRKHAFIRYSVAITVLLVIILYGIPYLYPTYLADINPQTIIDAQDFEREQGFVATSSFGEYLPIWNYAPPDANRLTPKFVQTPIISRLEAPPEVSIQTERWGNTWGELELTATAETTLTFDWFYFPGWYATLNSEPLDLVPSERVGLISTTIPAGQHRLTIALGNTERQQQAWGLSLVGVLAALMGLGIQKVYTSRRSVATRYTDTLTVSMPPSNRLPNRFLFTLLTAVMMLIVVKILVIDRIDTPLKHTRFNYDIENAVQYATNANFANRITLPGYDLASSTVISGQTVDLALYWQLIGRERVTTDYTTVLTLRNADGLTYAQHLDWQPGGLATRHWQPSYYLQQRIAFVIPADTPPGLYTLDLSLYDAQTGTSLDLINADGNPQGVELRLTPLIVARSEVQAASIIDTLPKNERLEMALNAEWRLISVGGWSDEAQVNVGQEITLDWRWQAQTQPTTTPTIRLLWIQDGDTNPRAETLIVEPILGFPLDQWRTGEIWRGLHRVIVPGTLTTGDYTLVLAVDEMRVIFSNRLRVIAPERIYTPPIIAYPTDVTWQNGIRLLGYEVTGDNRLTFYWQTTQPIPEDLSVFVHILGSNGTIIAQATGIPVNLTRPTTGWDIGEIIADTVNVAYPRGDDSLRVIVGWFNPRSGTRISLTLGDDFWTLPPIAR